MSGNTEQEAPISTYNVDQLFETKSIDEIRQFKSKIASDIEKKKEELRIMVGERYRDLIEAANTISSIKEGAEDVSNSVGRIEKMTKGISADRFASAEAGVKMRSESVLDEKKMKRMAYYALAGQIRLLMDAPEALWSAVESKENLLAAELYLLARQVYHSLKFSPGGGQTSLSCEKIMQWFPVISRQWGAISHFKDVILQASKNRLEDLSISPEAAAEELLTILLLRNITVENMVDQFLECRSKVLQRLLGLEGTRASSKHQICQILRLFSNTLIVVYSSFLDEGEGQVATKLLPKIGQRTLQCGNNAPDARKPPLSHMSIHGSPAGKYLPAKIKEFRPNPSHPVEPLNLKYLQEKCRVWIETCRAQVEENVPLWLGYVESVKNLATIRQAASDVIAEDPFSQAWDSVSSTLLPQKEDRFRRWEDLFLPSFTARVSGIIDAEWTLLSGDLSAKVLDFFARVEKDPSSEWNMCPYIWSESAGDLPEGDGWIRPATSAHITIESGGLPMKTLAYSREVLQLCRWVNEQVSKIIEDMEPYVDPEMSTIEIAKSGVSPFDQRADRVVVLKQLASAAKSACSRFLEEAFSYLGNEESEDFKVASAKVIYLARLCQAVPRLCTSLRKSVQFSHVESSLPIQRQHSVDCEFQAIWEEARSKAYVLWRKRLPVEFKSHLEAGFPSIGAATVLATLPQWDVMKIEEENEEGAKVVSSVSLPIGPSYALMNALLVVAEAVNAAGVHVIPVNVKTALAEGLVETLLDHYSTCLANKENRPVTQPIAIQLIFDIQHAAQLLLGRNNNNTTSVSSSAVNLLKEVGKLREQLEEFIDPFDLDVFTPLLNGNLKKCLGRTEGLFGVLAARDKTAQSLSSSEPKSLPSNDTASHSQGSSLIGSGSAHRFPLLPLAVQKPQSSLLDSYINTVSSTGGYTTPTPGHSRSSSYGSSAGMMLDKGKDVKAKAGSQVPNAEKSKRSDLSAKKKGDQSQQKSGAAFFFEAIGSNWFGSGTGS